MTAPIPLHSRPTAARLARPRLLATVLVLIVAMGMVGVSVGVWPTSYPAPAATADVGAGGTDGGQ